MYRTELTEQILKSPMAQKFIQMVSPIYGEAYTVLWLYQVIGAVMDNLDEWTDSIAQQVVPQTATWSITYWEEQYGIIPDPSWSLERRRQQILNKMNSRAPMNPYKVERILTVAAGADARIEENTGKNHFTVYINSKKDLVNEDYVRKELNTVKPAQLIYDIIYERYVEGAIHTAGIIRTYKEITLTHYA